MIRRWTVTAVSMPRLRFCMITEHAMHAELMRVLRERPRRPPLRNEGSIVMIPLQIWHKHPLRDCATRAWSGCLQAIASGRITCVSQLS